MPSSDGLRAEGQIELVGAPEGTNAPVLRGQTVRVIDNFSTGRWSGIEPFQSDIEPVDGDIRELGLLRSVGSAPFRVGKGQYQGGAGTGSQASSLASSSAFGDVLHLLQIRGQMCGQWREKAQAPVVVQAPGLPAERRLTPRRG